MLEELEIHNQFNESLSRFKNHDPHLKRLKNIPLVYHSSKLDERIFRNPGIYLITGGRQIGKTTFLKQFILNILENKTTNPKDILFISGEIIDTHHILRRIINQFYDESASFQFLFVDEINYIPNWDKSIKYLADSGVLEKMSVILTGSDSQIIRTSMKRFAGRRGLSDKVDFVFYPLSFKEFVCLKNKKLKSLCDQIVSYPLSSPLPEYEKHHNKLTELLNEYVIHGGYLPAINEYFLKKTISKGLMNTYVHWIIGDILKYNKSENYLFQILQAIKSTYNTQISWNNLSKKTSIDHHSTISDYCNILVSIHVLHIQDAIIEHKLVGAPKKNRKIYFRDPFIDHSITNYLNFEDSIDKLRQNIKDNKFVSSYIEAIAVDHCKRWFPTYYIKGSKGEVDIAIVQKNKMYPIEIKWTKRIRLEDIKHIQNYKNGIILTPNADIKKIKNNTLIPLTRFLIHINSKKITMI